MRAAWVWGSVLLSFVCGLALAQPPPPTRVAPPSTAAAPTREATAAFIARHLVDHGAFSCERPGDEPRTVVVHARRAASASVVGECGISYQFSGTQHQGADGHDWSYDCMLRFDHRLTGIAVHERAAPWTCGGNVEVSVDGVGVCNNGEPGDAQDLPWIPMDSREQAERLVRAMQHLGDLCYVAPPPDPF